MSSQPYVPPEWEKEAFNCPDCNAYANQEWLRVTGIAEDGRNVNFLHLRIGVCAHCQQYSLWHRERLICPESSPAPLPHDDLPEEVRADYKEARSIISRSPRGAAALLRLCIQKLCENLGGKGKNLNDDIAELVSQGLSPTIQKALDIVRVIGNESVHPGTLDLRDEPETALELCRLLNLIVEVMIAQPRAIDALYARLPAEKREAIEKRDGGE